MTRYIRAATVIRYYTNTTVYFLRENRLPVNVFELNVINNNKGIGNMRMAVTFEK